MVGMSNFDSGLHNFNYVDSMEHQHILLYKRKSAVEYKILYIYIYILQQFSFNMRRFLINVDKLCKPLSKLDLPTLRKGSTEERTQRNKMKNLTLARLEP